MEIQSEMETLAPYVAKAEGFAPTTDYRAVIKDLKKQQLDRNIRVCGAKPVQQGRHHLTTETDRSADT